ncbi:MAG: flagellar hook protein FlgE, partial [Campylobacteraceae bacterium]|nr:flagellar hook protein FlgE [Campylobacteraceae bacterium]
MLRSLWAGVSGLQAHQIALDVEGNNIANVNTAGFKYSRANFSDLLSQTSKIATAPQGELGGKNPMQVGLGTQISSITKIFKQGSVQVTDKNTDLAIQGDGFFVVSPDGGSTYKYTRNGDFNFDAVGNFTDGNGYIIQGWMRDDKTGNIDSTTPIQNITIPPGLTTPANDTSFITLKANLNAGDKIVNKSTIYSLDQNHGWVDADGNGIQDSTETHDENGISTADALFDVNKNMYERGEDFGALFNSTGQSFALSEGQGAWVSYADSKYSSTTVKNTSGITVDMTINGVQIGGPTSTYTSTSTVASQVQEDNVRYIQDLINQHSSETGVSATVTGGAITLKNSNQLGTEANMKNLNVVVNTANDNTNMLDIAGGAPSTLDIITAFQYTYTKNSASTVSSRSDARHFHTTEDLRNSMQTDARKNTDYLGNGWTAPSANLNDGLTIKVNDQGQYEVQNVAGDAFNADDGDVVTSLDSAGNPWTLTTANLIDGSGNLNENTFFPAGSNLILVAGTDTVKNTTGPVTLPEGTVYDIGSGSTTAGAGGVTIATNSTFSELTLPSTAGATFLAGSTFSNTATTVNAGTNTKTINDFDTNLTITDLTNTANKISENKLFGTTLKTLQGALPTGNNIRASQGIYAASHASSIDVYDSLGSKHTVRLEFRKVGTTSDGGARWNMIISVPEPGVINDTGFPENILTGQITFGSDGSLSAFSPSSIRYTPNNGATSNQPISLSFGTAGQFDGMTSYDSQSNTSGISQDGYPGGDLSGIRVDETGTLIGSFTNGRSFGLDQVSMARFKN